MKAILERRSIRKYTNQKISDDIITNLLKAAMAAPSSVNEQPWEFIIIKERKILDKIAEINPYGQMLKEADTAIVVCGDEKREIYKGYWVQDCSAATENILIAAQYQGLGSVWLGIYPDKAMVNSLKSLLNIPDSVYPFSIVSLGYPAEKKAPSNRYDESRIHHNIW